MDLLSINLLFTVNSLSLYAATRKTSRGTMISFELSVMDLVLAIAIVTLLLLYITKISTKYAAKSKLSPQQERVSEESDARAVSKSSSRDSSGFSVKCPHHFGYLKALPLGSSVPEECYSCSRMMQCLFEGKE